MKQIKPQAKNYSMSEIEKMTPTGIYMLMEEKGADVFGLWPADKSDIVKSYGKQVGFRPDMEDAEKPEAVSEETQGRKN